VDWGGVNRPRAVRARPGGKGLNVARTLHALGVDVLVLGLAGGLGSVMYDASRLPFAINIATQLNKVFTAAVRDYLSAEPAVVDPRRYGRK
jgi:fructose-bisphosphate aldolase, class II